MWPSVAFSGIQPTGVLHIGNYFGAVKTWLELQESVGKQLMISIVDLHALTEFREPKEMRSNILDMAASLIACGIDPQKTCLFQQSRIPEHSELAWILECFVTVPHLQRLTHYKDKSSKFKDGSAPVGLLCYPVLQAADIL
jgi:tryptophanyl-tRNA synthetase